MDYMPDVFDVEYTQELFHKYNNLALDFKDITCEGILDYYKVREIINQYYNNNIGTTDYNQEMRNIQKRYENIILCKKIYKLYVVLMKNKLLISILLLFISLTGFLINYSKIVWCILSVFDIFNVVINMCDMDSSLLVSAYHQYAKPLTAIKFHVISQQELNKVFENRIL